MDWISAALTALSAAVGAWIATVAVRRWHDRPVVCLAAVIASFAVFDVVSERFLLPHTHRMWGAALAESSSPESPLTRIDDSALSLWLPGPLTPRSVSLPPASQASVSRFHVSTYDGGGVSIAVSHVVSKPGTPTNLDGAIEGALNNLRSMSRGADLEWSRRPWLVDGRSGAIVDLRVHGAENELAGHALFLAEPTELWQVLILYKPDLAAGETVTTRLIGSARFDRPSSTPG